MPMVMQSREDMMEGSWKADGGRRFIKGGGRRLHGVGPGRFSAEEESVDEAFSAGVVRTTTRRRRGSLPYLHMTDGQRAFSQRPKLELSISGACRLNNRRQLASAPFSATHK